jgi:hypothetical protein
MSGYPLMGNGWAVEVRRHGDVVVCIEDRMLAGRDLSEEDADLIRGCAQQLLSFVGPKKVKVCACPGYADVKGPYPSGFCKDCGCWFPPKGKDTP